jgi:hypothetical protein
MPCPSSTNLLSREPSFLPCCGRTGPSKLGSYPLLGGSIPHTLTIATSQAPCTRNPIRAPARRDVLSKLTTRGVRGVSQLERDRCQGRLGNACRQVGRGTGSVREPGRWIRNSPWRSLVSVCSACSLMGTWPTGGSPSGSHERAGGA